MTLHTYNQHEKLDYSISVLKLLKTWIKTLYLEQYKTVRSELPVLVAVLDSKFADNSLNKAVVPSQQFPRRGTKGEKCLNVIYPGHFLPFWH